MQYQGKSLRKSSGGRRVRHHKKKKREMGRLPALTTVGKTRRRNIKTRGGGQKTLLLSHDEVNIVNPKTNKAKKVKLLDVVENSAHHQFAKLKIVTKGAIVETEEGKARVTSRPGQAGVINAVLLEKK